MRKKHYILLCVYFFCAAALQAQPYYFTHYQVENGLSNNAVLSSMQDRKGFMWFGTKDGLNRFDGYTFKIFQNDPRSPFALGSNYVRVLLEARDGNIWVGTDQGIYLYNPHYERFTLFKTEVVDEILDIQEDKQGNIWFINDLILYKYLPTKDTIVQVTKNHDISAFCLSRENTRLIWIGTSNGDLFLYDKLDQAFTPYNVFKSSPPVNDRRIEKIFCTGKDRLLIGTKKQGIKIFDTKTLKYKDLISTDPNNESIFVRDILRLTQSEYWFATESGIIVYNEQTGHIQFLVKEQDNPWSLADNAVYTLCKDQEGAVWAGTYFGGLNYYSKVNTFFEKFFPKSLSNSISGYAVREITKDQYGYLWIGTEDGGLNKFHPQKEHFTHFKPSTLKNGNLSHKNVHGLMASGDTIWIGTFEHGLDWMDAKKGTVIRHFNAENKDGALHSNFIFSILKTKNGQILLATVRGLYIYDPSAKKFERSPHVPQHIFYTSLYEDNDGVIWVGTWRNGLFYFDPSDNTRETPARPAVNASSPSSNRINRVFQDSRQIVWIATEGGLYQFDKKEKNFKRFEHQDRLPSNLILSVVEDDNGVLWISTSKGLARYSPTEKDIKVFTKHNGLPNDQFNYNSSYKDDEGYIYFGTLNGFIRFRPDHYKEPAYEAPVYITGFQIDNEEIKIGTKDSPFRKSVILTEKIVLKHHQSTFSIDFAALSYASPSMTEYAYKMEGLDREWIRLKTNRKVYFTNIRPGKYIFRVNVVDSKGGFKGKETKLYIEVSPPLWASIPAFITYGLVIISVGSYVIWNYDRKIKERNRRRLEAIKHQREKNLYQAKIDFFTHIVHEIRTPLTLIKAPLEKVVQNISPSTPAIKKHLQMIERNTDRLISLSGQLLDFRQVEAHGFKLSFKKINVNKLITDLHADFYLSAEKRKMSFTVDLPDRPVYAHADKEALTKIITNLLDNALKYGKKQITLSACCVGVPPIRQVQITVMSDGALIPLESREKVFEPFYRMKAEKHKQGTGIGLALSRSLAELMGGTLDLTDEGDQNTFVLTLPESQI